MSLFTVLCTCSMVYAFAGKKVVSLLRIAGNCVQNKKRLRSGAQKQSRKLEDRYK